MRIVLLFFIFFGLAMLVTLALPASGETWSNSSRFFLGAEVYTEKEIVDMRAGRITQLNGNITPVDPIGYAKRIIIDGRLTESKGMGSVRYYVVPRLHPKLNIFIPSLCMVGIGFLAYFIVYENRKPKHNS